MGTFRSPLTGDDETGGAFGALGALDGPREVGRGPTR